MRNTRGFAHILILIAIVIVGAVLIFGKDKLKSVVTVGSPVPSASLKAGDKLENNTNEWKNYVSSDLGFSVDYPPYSLLKVESKGVQILICGENNVSSCEEGFPDAAEGGTVSILFDPDFSRESVLPQCLIDNREKTEVINSIKWTLYSGEITKEKCPDNSYWGWFEKDAFTTDNGDYVRILGNLDKNKEGLYQEAVFDQILASFKFVENANPRFTPEPYKCPTTEYVDCMPGIKDSSDEAVDYIERCSSNYLDWAMMNCSGFKGATY